MNNSKFLVLLAILFSPFIVLQAAPVAEAETTLTTKTNWGWFYNQTAAQINAAKNTNSRPIKIVANGLIEIEPRYHVLYVANAGDYKVNDWNVVIRTLDNVEEMQKPIVRTSGWRVTNIAVHEIKIGNQTHKRAATINVKDDLYKDHDVRSWLTETQFKALGNNFRVVDMNRFVTNGTPYFSGVIVPNTGKNYKNWGWRFADSKNGILEVSKNINGKKFRITDFQRVGDGKFDAIIVESKGEVEKWYSNQTDDSLKNDVLRRHGSYNGGGNITGGARFMDISVYPDGNGEKIDVLTMENGVGEYPSARDNVKGFEGIDAEFLQTMSRHGIPGGNFALSKNGKVIYRAAFGYSDLAKMTPAKQDNRGRIASITKTITASALMKLVEEKKVGLDDLVFGDKGILKAITPFDYKGYSGNTVATLDKITVRHLLNHTAGWDRQKSGDPDAKDGVVCDGNSECEPTMSILPRILTHAKKQKTTPDSATQLETIDDIIRYMMKPDDKDYLPVTAPGTKFAYSNFGYTVLQKIIEVKSGKPYETYINEMATKMGVQFFPGRSKPENKLTNEWTYHDTPGAGTTKNPAWSSTALANGVTNPYWYDMQMLLGHGGYVTTPADLVKFAAKVDGSAASPWISDALFHTMTARPAYITDKKTPYYALSWRVEPMGTDTDEQLRFEHGGALTGASSLTLKSWHHRKVSMAFLFNARVDGADSEIQNGIEPIIGALDDDGTLGKLIK